MDLAPDDVDTAARWVVSISSGVLHERWHTSRPGAWSPRRTLDHLVDVMLLYSGYVATRATERTTPVRDGDPDASPIDLMNALSSSSSILTALLREMPDGVRVFHPSGTADRTGWIGMACTELLVHGFDIATATQGPVALPHDALARAVVERVLPWAAHEGDGWSQLLWATGRASVGALPPQGADWWWQSAPLDDWDGVPRRRDAPPQW